MPTTAELHDTPAVPPPDTATDTRSTAARVSFRQPVSTSGQIDAGWWPRSRDLTAELPALLDVLWTADRDVNRITYNLAAWDPAPRRLVIDGHRVHLGGFATGDPHAVELVDAWGRERIDVVVIPAATDPAEAERALALASSSDDLYGAGEILAHAATGRDQH